MLFKKVVEVITRTTTPESIELCIPRGSVLGPLLFLIYIDHIAIYLAEFTTNGFGDDTTLIKIGTDIENLIKEFSQYIKRFLQCFKYNRKDINWSKRKNLF